VGELPLALQPKLLRALQSGEIQRVGSDRNLDVDVRVIAATNRDLASAVKQGRFRPDLFHRLSVYPIHVPPLRERAGDVRILASHFLDGVRVKLGLGPVRFTAEALALLEEYSWPGNVRELEHVVTRSALRASAAKPDGDLAVDALHLDLHPPDDGLEPCPADVCLREGPDAPFGEAVDSFKRGLISRALVRSGGNWSEAARRLEVDRGNLYRIGKRLGLV